MILAGQVKVDGQVDLESRRAGRPTARCSSSSRQTIRTSGAAASKLAHALDAFAIDPQDAARSTSAPRPAASPTSCCGAARPA